MNAPPKPDLLPPHGARARRRQIVAAFVYAATVAGLLLASAWLAIDLVERARGVSAQAALLSTITRRSALLGPSNSHDSPVQGSPFLEGETVTIAGAALQQRVEGAIAKAGGFVLSSQVELDGPDAKAGAVRVVTNFEIAQPALQGLLYDIEAGMPFLVIDPVTIEAPQGIVDDGNARLRVLVGVEGQWLRTQ